MRSLLVTGSDTGIGKTRVTAALVRLLAAPGRTVQVVKVVETGRAPGEEDDGGRCLRLPAGGGGASRFTLATFPLPRAPATASAAAGRERFVARAIGSRRRRCRKLATGGFSRAPAASLRQSTQAGSDWVDFALRAGVEAVVLVVPDRLGAINQARLVWAGAIQAQALNAGIWLNAVAPVDPAVAASNRTQLRALGVPIWAEQGQLAAALPEHPDVAVRDGLELTERPRRRPPPPSGGRRAEPGDPLARFQAALAERERKRLRRVLRVSEPSGRRPQPGG